MSSTRIPIGRFNTDQSTGTTPTHGTILLCEPIPLCIRFEATAFLVPCHTGDFDTTKPVHSPLAAVKVTNKRRAINVTRVQPGTISTKVASYKTGATYHAIRANTTSATDSIGASTSNSNETKASNETTRDHTATTTDHSWSYTKFSKIGVDAACQKSTCSRSVQSYHETSTDTIPIVPDTTTSDIDLDNSQTKSSATDKGKRPTTTTYSFDAQHVLIDYPRRR